MENNYKYTVNLDREVIRELAVILAPKNYFTARNFIKTIENYHVLNGGYIESGKDYIGPLNKVLYELEKKGLVEKATRGTWRFVPIASNSTIPKKNNKISTDLGLFENIENKEKEKRIIADLVIGEEESNKSVYVYYFDTSRNKAKENSKIIWECKIGKAPENPKSRIDRQFLRQGLEKPHVAIVYKTSNPLDLETAIHKILTIRGRKVSDAQGKEWYFTNPDEVLEIIEYIYQKKYSPN